MEMAIVIFIVALCALYWVGRIAPSVTRFLWQGLSRLLKLIHAPASIQQWTLKRAIPDNDNKCSGCKKCGGKCH